MEHTATSPSLVTEVGSDETRFSIVTDSSGPSDEDVSEEDTAPAEPAIQKIPPREKLHSTTGKI